MGIGTGGKPPSGKWVSGLPRQDAQLSRMSRPVALTLNCLVFPILLILFLSLNLSILLTQKCQTEEVNENIVSANLGALGKEEEYISIVGCLMGTPSSYHCSVARGPNLAIEGRAFWIVFIWKLYWKGTIHRKKGKPKPLSLLINSIFIHSFVHSFSFS